MIATKSKTVALLEKHHVKVRKNYGQNFMIEPSVVKKIAQNCGATNETTVIEIGPGLGSLTQMLLEKSKSVIAYEIDPQMVEVVTSELSQSALEVQLIDFLEVDLDRLDLKDVVVCSNVPYYITTPIIFKCLESALPIRQLTLMVQKEMAQRLNAKPNSKHYNALSVIMDLFFIRKTMMIVPAECFYPKPNVDSAVIQLIRNDVDHGDKKQLIQFLKLCFAQRRKTLVNNLKQYGVHCVESALEKLNLSLTCRAQELTVQQFIDLYACFDHESLSKLRQND